MQRLAITLLLATLLPACAADHDAGGDATDASDGAGAPDAAAAPGADAAPGGAEQTPPTGATALEAWLAAGHYNAWRCETAAHPARPPGAHGTTRICSNELLAAAPAGAFPAGAAAVKEIYAGGTINGWAVSLKQQADSAGGDGWYWYERIGSSTYADGAGVGLCTGCHAGAGDDFAATARDFVFTVVP